MARNKPQAKFKLDIWDQDPEGLYYCDPKMLAIIICQNQVDFEEICRLMGSSYHKLANALNGDSVDQWDVQMIEHGILRKDTPQPLHSGPSLH